VTYRRLNRSRPWRAAEAAKLEQVPACETCAAPAQEMHDASRGCFTSEPPALDETVALCRDCHDDTGCTAHRTETFVTQWIEIAE
jgi:hypothetical protein